MQHNLGRLHTEWLTANLSRAYPLADATGGMPGTIPCRLLADAFILIYGDVKEHETTLYINKVISSSTEVVFYLTGRFGDNYKGFGPVATFDKQCDIGTVKSFEISHDGILVSGKLVAGDLHSGDDIPTALDLTETTGALFPGCYRVAPPGLQGIEVDGIIYTGVVELVAGDGINISVDEQDTHTAIVISVPEYTLPDENLVIVDDKTLLREAIEEYGVPVRSLNNFKPDEEGNIDIVADEVSITEAQEDVEGLAETEEPETPEEEDEIKMYLTVKEINSPDDPISDAGSGVIQVTITKPQECELSEVLDSLLSMTQELNQRATKLDSAITTIDTAQANLASRLTGLA